MSRDKQIEEMAKDINIANHEYCNGRCIGCEHKPKRIEDCACIDIAIATGLTAKGYRKASDLAEEIFGEIDKYLEKWISYNKDKKINASFGFDKELYERCEMRIANLERYQKDMSELKKKYTESEDSE